MVFAPEGSEQEVIAHEESQQGRENGRSQEASREDAGWKRPRRKTRRRSKDHEEEVACLREARDEEAVRGLFFSCLAFPARRLDVLTLRR